MKKKYCFLVLVGALLFFNSESRADDDADLERIFPRRHGAEINKVELAAGASVRGWIKVDNAYKRTEIVCGGKAATKLTCELYTEKTPSTTITGAPNGYNTVIGLKIGGQSVTAEFMSVDNVKKIQAKLEEYRATGICLPEVPATPADK